MKYYIPLTDKDERECIRMAQTGDKECFGRLVEKYKAMLKGHCEEDLHCNDPENLVYDAFRKAWQNIKLYEARNDATFFTWLKTIARNHYFNLRDKEKRESSIILRMKVARDSIFNLSKGRTKKEPDDQEEPIEKVKKDNEIMENFLDHRGDRGKHQNAAEVEENARRIAVKDCVQRQLGKVRPKYRDVIELVHLRDMSYKDAAQQLNWDLEQVRKRLNVALKEAAPLLRECL